MLVYSLCFAYINIFILFISAYLKSGTPYTTQGSINMHRDIFPTIRIYIVKYIKSILDTAI